MYLFFIDRKANLGALDQTRDNSHCTRLTHKDRHLGRPLVLPSLQAGEGGKFPVTLLDKVPVTKPRDLKENIK